MATSLKTGFTQIFSCCPKNLSRPKFGGATAPLAPPPPGPYAYVIDTFIHHAPQILHSVYSWRICGPAYCLYEIWQVVVFFAPCLDGFGCVCWRPVLDEALKVWPYLLCRRSLALLRPPNNNFFRIGQLKQIFTISVRKKKSSYSFAGRFLYCLTDFKPVAPYVAVSRSFFCLQPSLFMNLQTVFFPQTGSLNFFRLLRVFITPSVRLNRSAVNAVQ